MTCEICFTSVKLDKHHIQSKSKGGSNKSHNIANLCPNCHRRVHTGEIILEGKFMTTDGIKLFYHKSTETSILKQKLPEIYKM